MSFSLHGVIESIKGKGARYSAVSVVNVIIGQGLLLVLHSWFHWPSALANACSVLISAFPAYYLSRRWVWGKSGKSHFKKEVLPFWIFVAIGFVFSTLMVALTAYLTGTTGEATDLSTIQKLLPNLVNMASFGLLWVVRFFLMEKLFEQNPELAEELVGQDFIEAVEGPEKLAAAEAAAEQRRHTGP
ncbi:MAG: GtrA family protein [Actinomycetes bacterium]